MSYLIRAYLGRRLDGESNESVYSKYGMSSRGEGIVCGVIGMIKCSILRWFGHTERMLKNEVAKRVYVNKVGVRG